MKAHKHTKPAPFITSSLFDPDDCSIQVSQLDGSYSTIIFRGTLAQCEWYLAHKLQSQQEMFDAPIA